MMNRSHLMNTLSYENYCLKAKLQELLEKIAKLQDDMLQYNTNNEQLVPSENTEIAEYKEIINKRDIEIVYLKEMIVTLTATLPPEKDESSEKEQLQDKIAQYECIIQKQSSEMEKICDEMNKLQCVISLYDTQSKDLITQLSTKDQQIAELTTQLSTKDQQIAELTTQLSTKDQQITLKDLENEQLKIIVTGKDAEITHLKMTCPQPPP